ncbi:MAG: methionine ABC transporter ATP-binding protein [Microbacteriaceae bacterium]
MSEIIRLVNVNKTFRASNQEIHALDDISLTINSGEIFGIIGQSGAGKSTLVRLINGLEQASSGSIFFDGVDIRSHKERELRPIRSQIGMIFQQFNLMRSRTVFGNVEFPLIVAKVPKAERQERVWEILEFVGLTQRAYNYPEQLSGGQKQRVGIARALVASPKVLLADEATSALDPQTTQDVLKLLKKVNQELGITIVLITHEMEVLKSIADRVAVLESGKLVEQGEIFDLFVSPQSEATQNLLDTVYHDRPDSEQLEKIFDTRNGRIIMVQIRADNRVGEVLARATEYGVSFDFVFGSINTLKGKEFGSFTIELNGSDEQVARVITEFEGVTEVQELTR